MGVHGDISNDGCVFFWASFWYKMAMRIPWKWGLMIEAVNVFRFIEDKSGEWIRWIWADMGSKIGGIFCAK